MRPSCSQIYSSPFLDLIFSALLEIQPKLSRNAVTYLKCARNPEQFWSIWGYLSMLPAQSWQPSSWESFCCPSCPTSSTTPKVPRDARAGCSQGCALLQPHLSHPIPVGMVRGARGAEQAQHTPPQGPPPQDTSCSSPAQHLLLQLTRGWPSTSQTHGAAFQNENTDQGRHFLQSHGTRAVLVGRKSCL